MIVCQNPSVKPGDRCGSWTVIGAQFRISYGSRKKNYMCVVRCDCGIVSVRSAQSLREKTSTHCGCQADQSRWFKQTHGRQPFRLYNVWAGMKGRCSNSDDRLFARYGGRGITVCQEWQDFEPFRDWALKNGWQHGLQIDRIDNNGNYEPGNCRCVTNQENANNTRRTRPITAFGETKSIYHWSLDGRCRIPPKTLRGRIDCGWEPEKAITTPLRIQRRAIVAEVMPDTDEDFMPPEGYVTEERAEELFVGGLQAMREMLARFVEGTGDPHDNTIAQSIRANWNSSWGKDPGRPKEVAKTCWEL